jgi:hypothetical protein
MNKHKKKIMLLSLLISVLFYLYADSTEWVRIDLPANGESRAKHFLDLDSFKPRGIVINLWEKYLEPDNSYFSTKVSINCEKREFKILYNYKYDAKGQLIESNTSPSEWVTIAPTSQNDLIYFLLCRDGKPKPSNELAEIKKAFREPLFERE